MFFRTYANQDISSDQEDDSEEELESVEEEEDEEVMEDLGEILGNIGDSDIILPPHFRCASHTLNRVAVHDCEKALNDKKFARTYKLLLSKCNFCGLNRISHLKLLKRLKKFLVFI